MADAAHEYEPTPDPVAVLRAASGRGPALDQEIAAAAARVASEREERAVEPRPE